MDHYKLFTLGFSKLFCFVFEDISPISLSYIWTNSAKYLCSCFRVRITSALSFKESAYYMTDGSSQTRLKKYNVLQNRSPQKAEGEDFPRVWLIIEIIIHTNIDELKVSNVQLFSIIFFLTREGSPNRQSRNFNFSHPAGNHFSNSWYFHPWNLMWKVRTNQISAYKGD